MITPKEYEVIKPTDKNVVIKENVFLFKNIKNDWEPLDKSLAIDMDRLNDENRQAKSFMKSQSNRTKYSAWGVSPLLHKQLDAYLITKNEKHLSDFILFYDYFLSVRMDNKRRVNFEGKLSPQWERLDRYNIFYVSPYNKFDINNKEKVMKERGWSSLFFSDANYSGLFIDPILRFVQIVKSNNIKKYESIADSMFKEVGNVIASHENEWVSLENRIDTRYSKGYYIFPKNSPWYLDGVEIPVNEIAIFGSSLVRAYQISKDEKYIVRALNMWNRWKEYIAKDPFGYISYPYFTGAPYLGWGENSNISMNTPTFKPYNHKVYENFHKAAITIDFLILLEQVVPGAAVEYLEEFYYLMVAAMVTKTVTSSFPGILGFGYPYNTYHAALPYGSKGWVHLAAQNKNFSNQAPNYLINKKGESLGKLLYFQYISEKDISEFDFVKYSTTVSPGYLENKKQQCLWKSTIDGLLSVKFQHTSPKNNTLYLYDPRNEKRKIRMNVVDGAFYTSIFTTKGECLDLRWKKSKHGSPKNIAENKLILSYYKSKSEFIKDIGGGNPVEASPRYLKDSGGYCLWKPPISGSVKIKYQHTSPKHNTLYLYNFVDKKKLKLKLKDGTFYTNIYVNKGRCLDLRWKESKHGSPSNTSENKIFIKYTENQFFPSGI